MIVLGCVVFTGKCVDKPRNVPRWRGIKGVDSPLQLANITLIDAYALDSGAASILTASKTRFKFLQYLHDFHFPCTHEDDVDYPGRFRKVKS